MHKMITALALLGFSALTIAADAIGATEKQATNWHAIITVSYTHLTLPTNREV